MAIRRPEIILTDEGGELLEVDVLAYPEDKHLIVDPYTVLHEQQASMGELIAQAEATLPRPLGEIIPAQVRIEKVERPARSGKRLLQRRNQG